MKWTKRILIGLPVVIAALLTMLMSMADRFFPLQLQHIAGYGFFFSAPWAWLVDRIPWNLYSRSRSAETVMSYIASLWIPALLYSASLWFICWAAARLQMKNRKLTEPVRP